MRLILFSVFPYIIRHSRAYSQPFFTVNTIINTYGWEMSGRGNILVGKCPVGEVPAGELASGGSVRILIR